MNIYYYVIDIIFITEYSCNGIALLSGVISIGISTFAITYLEDILCKDNNNIVCVFM